jgi:hypothetical protein
MTSPLLLIIAAAEPIDIIDPAVRATLGVANCKGAVPMTIPPPNIETGIFPMVAAVPPMDRVLLLSMIH